VGDLGGDVVAGGVEDAVSAAEGSAGGADGVEGVGEVGAVVGVFVGEDRFGGGGDGARGVSVHAGDGVGPLPAVAVAVVAEPSDTVRGTGLGGRFQCAAAVFVVGFGHRTHPFRVVAAWFFVAASLRGSCIERRSIRVRRRQVGVMSLSAAKTRRSSSRAMAHRRVGAQVRPSWPGARRESA